MYVAAALTEYDGNTEVIEDARYGTLQIEHYGWGYEGELGSREKSLETHYCSDEELGFVQGPNTQFYDINPLSFEEVQTWKKKFKCADKENMKIWGDYNSRAAQ